MVKGQYYTDSRAPRYSILFALPLLLAYETLAWGLTDPAAPSVRNGADVILKSLFLWLGGQRGLLAFEILLVALGTWLVVRDWKAHPGPLRAGVFAGMLGESAALGLLVGFVVRRITFTLLHFFQLSSPSGLDVPTQLLISLGAGIYEELLFRVILVGALAAFATKVLRLSPRGAGITACVIGALLFSGFHYVGPYGDKLEMPSFLFRFLAGLVFSALYLLRGFGITAWTHALYDVFVTLGSAA